MAHQAELESHNTRESTSSPVKYAKVRKKAAKRPRNAESAYRVAFKSGLPLKDGLVHSFYYAATIIILHSSITCIMYSVYRL